MDNIAILKKDLYVAVISNGSATQKERAIETAQTAFEWCVSHIGQSTTTGEQIATVIEVPIKRVGRPKKADK